MPILQATSSVTGLVDVVPGFVFIQTNDTPAVVTGVGYLNRAIQEGLLQVNDSDIAFVSTETLGVTLSKVYSIAITGIAPNLNYSLVTPPAAAAIFDGFVQAGINGLAGQFFSFPPTLNSGFLNLHASDNLGNFVTIITNDPLGQTTTFSIPDPGVAAAEFVLTESIGTQTINSGNLAIATGDLELGSDGNPSTLTIFPLTTGNGSLVIVASDAGGSFDTTITNSLMGQSSIIGIPDPSSSTADFVLTESGGTQVINSGNLSLASGDLELGSDGNASSLTVFPSTSGNGTLKLLAVDAGAAFNTTISNSLMGQSSVVSIPDPGVGVADFILSDSASGSQIINTGNLELALGALSLGSSGNPSSLTIFPAAASNGTLKMSAVNAGGAFDTTISNSVMGQSSVISIPDPVAASANFLVDAGPSNLVFDYQRMVSLSSMMLAPAGGAFVLTRNAQGNWSQRHTPAANTSILAFDISEQLRAAANRGFELVSFDVIYSIATIALVAHSVTLSTTNFLNNTAVNVSNIAITASLATATQANPYVTNCAVTVPTWNNPAASTSVKQVIEVTVNAAATTVYNMYGVNLRFTKSIK